MIDKGATLVFCLGLAFPDFNLCRKLDYATFDEIVDIVDKTVKITLS